VGGVLLSRCSSGQVVFFFFGQAIHVTRSYSGCVCRCHFVILEQLISFYVKVEAASVR
jgi:hypothetical protein